MRGTPSYYAGLGHGGGIIPAYAGNTMSLKNVSLRCWDHPRVCGEHSSSPWMLSEATGSSPRMRGTLHPPSGRQQPAGIIPAYAGNTSNTRLRVRTPRDHPRVCGEHFIEQTDAPRIVGSSPRMRGTPVLRSFRGLRMVIIPAYAGNTGRQSCRPFWRRDHPRVCGEHS